MRKGSIKLPDQDNNSLVAKYRRLADQQQADIARDLHVGLSTVCRWEKDDGPPEGSLHRALLEEKYKDALSKSKKQATPKRE